MRIPESELHWTAVTASGPGGQHVNRSQTAVQLRFDIHRSSLPAAVKQRLLASGDRRITGDGQILILSQEHRSQQRNRAAALERLEMLVKRAFAVPKKRRATRATKASKERRLKAKNLRGKVKTMRGRVDRSD